MSPPSAKKPGRARGPHSVPISSAPEHFEQIADSLTSGVIAFDADGVITVVNRAAREHLGVGEDRLHKGMRIDDLLLVKPFVDVMLSVLASGTPLSRQEIVVPLADGTKREIGYSASLLQGPKPFNGAVFLFVDMTERRALERAAELNRQLAQIGQLTAGVVHELRNPLGVISGMAEMLEAKIPPDDPCRRHVAAILVETKNLARLTSQFLGFAKPFELEVKPCPPGAVVKRTAGLCLPRAQAKNVTLGEAAQAGLPDMQADLERLAQALVNIVNNAIDAVPQSGHVALAVRREEDDIVFEITDDGPGIHLKPGEDLFKPFFSKKESGTGLGLAICHRIVTAHAGVVTYGNREEGGARFMVRIPIERRPRN